VRIQRTVFRCDQCGREADGLPSTDRYSSDIVPPAWWHTEERPCPWNTFRADSQEAKIYKHYCSERCRPGYEAEMVALIREILDRLPPKTP